MIVTKITVKTVKSGWSQLERIYNRSGLGHRPEALIRTGAATFKALPVVTVYDE